jgi:mRNA-degrading endonuclease toxin of MazEF toxin-antitoxin module
MLDDADRHPRAGRRAARRAPLRRGGGVQLGRVVTVVEMTTRARGIEAEVALPAREGLPRRCSANADDLVTIDKTWLVERAGVLGPDKIRLLDRALLVALGRVASPR